MYHRTAPDSFGGVVVGGGWVTVGSGSENRP